MICAIVLAAGESRRMGKNKMLLPFRDTTMIGHVVDQILKSCVDHVFVVVGHEGDRVANALCHKAVNIIKNPEYKSGMLSSVRCGLRALPPEATGVLIALGDHPAISNDLIDELVHAFNTAGKGILVPVFEGNRGHPIVFSARYIAEVEADFDETGLRGLLRAHSDDLAEFPTSHPAILSDIDRPEDYEGEINASQKRT